MSPYWGRGHRGVNTLVTGGRNIWSVVAATYTEEMFALLIGLFRKFAL